MSKKQMIEEKVRLRELASQTLEAYRRLNSAAAEASTAQGESRRGDGLAKASELLQSVVTQINGTPRSGDG